LFTLYCANTDHYHVVFTIVFTGLSTRMLQMFRRKFSAIQQLGGQFAISYLLHDNNWWPQYVHGQNNGWRNTHTICLQRIPGTRRTDAIRVATAMHNYVNSDRETGCQNYDCHQAYYSFLCHSFNKAHASVEW